jgi:hypothetical protein
MGSLAKKSWNEDESWEVEGIKCTEKFEPLAMTSFMYFGEDAKKYAAS